MSLPPGDMDDPMISDALRGEFAHLYDESIPDSSDREEAIIQVAVARFHQRGRAPRLVRRGIPVMVTTAGVVIRSAMGPLLRHWRLSGGALATAAAIVILATMTFPGGASVHADGRVQAMNRQFLVDGPYPDPASLNDSGEVTARWSRIREAESERDFWKSRAKIEPETPDEGYYPPGLALHAWTRVYRGLRDLGEWSLALEEMNAALRYTQQTESPSRTSLPDWHAVVLHDLGQLFAMTGDHDQAKTWYERSIAVRMANYGRPTQPDRPQPGKEAGYASSLAPLYWRLADLALVENDLDEARRNLDRAEQLLSDYFRAFSDALGIPAAPGTPLIDIYRGLPTEYLKPLDPLPREQRQAAVAKFLIERPGASQVVKVREHLLRVARVRRAEDDLEGATAALDAATDVSYYAIADESRLDFAEPIERARIAIAKGDYDIALASLRTAIANSGPVSFPGDPDADKLPVSPLLVAQARMLTGAILLQADPDDRSGLDMIADACGTADRLVAAIKSPSAKEQLSRPFREWRKLFSNQAD